MEGHPSDPAIDIFHDDGDSLFEEVNQVIIPKGGEFYIFRYRDDQVDEVLRRLARMAAMPNIPLSWHDAACASTKIREMNEHVQMLSIEPFVDETLHDDSDQNI